jgi:hypothetical protein
MEEAIIFANQVDLVTNADFFVFCVAFLNKWFPTDVNPNFAGFHRVFSYLLMGNVVLLNEKGLTCQ